MEHPNCSKCNRVTEECNHEQVRECLWKSQCTSCGGALYNDLLSDNEIRTCKYCGVEWPVYK